MHFLFSVYYVLREKNIPTVVCAVSPDDEQVVLEKSRGC
jgi:hypothetical protein